MGNVDSAVENIEAGNVVEGTLQLVLSPFDTFFGVFSPTYSAGSKVYKAVQFAGAPLPSVNDITDGTAQGVASVFGETHRAPIRKDWDWLVDGPEYSVDGMTKWPPSGEFITVEEYRRRARLELRRREDEARELDAALEQKAGFTVLTPSVDEKKEFLRKHPLGATAEEAAATLAVQRVIEAARSTKVHPANALDEALDQAIQIPGRPPISEWNRIRQGTKLVFL